MEDFMVELIEKNIGETLREQAVKYNDREFVVFPNRGVRYTFGEMYQKSGELAKGLLAAGFKKGDHIGIWASNVPEWAVLFFAAARIGIVVVPVNSSYKDGETGYIIGHAGLKGLFIIDRFRGTDFVETLYQLMPQLKNTAAGSLNMEKFPCLKLVANIDKTRHSGMFVIEDILNMGSHFDMAALQKAESAVVNTDTLCIMYTSGTTGVPKGAMLSHRNIVNNAQFATGRGRAGGDTVFLNPLPLFHVMSLNGIIEALVYGSKTCVLEYFDPLASLAAIQNEKCTWIYGVPAIYAAMLSHPRFNDFNLDSLQYCSFGGSLSTGEILKNVMEKMRARDIYIGYGLTETSPLVTDCWVNDPDQKGIVSVGHPIRGVEISIRDSGNRECPVNETGEICARGHNVMKGYYKMEAATKGAIDTDGWFHTGDLGHLLPNGCLVIDGRLKELIIRGGENVYPKEVENLLLAMRGIRDAQVAGIPSKKYGEEVGAFIILQPGEAIGKEEVIEFCKGKISSFKIPKYVFFVQSFPLTASGKVQKSRLSEIGLKEVQQEGLAT
jgi:fatty-acyl-CoA synthase